MYLPGVDVETLQAKNESLAPALTEQSRRLWATTETLALGHGGIALVKRGTVPLERVFASFACAVLLYCATRG